MQNTVHKMKRFATAFAVVALSGLAVQTTFAQKIEFAKERKAVVKHYRFVGDHREESMWSALYGAKSGKIYIGLCCHAEAAHFYEFDPATEKMRHIVDLTELHEERGEGINTNGKIHVRMGEDNDGNIAEVIIAKNRHGSTGTVKMGWIGQYTKFRTIADNIPEQ